MAIVAEEDLNQIEEFEDTDAILKRLMPVLPIFSEIYEVKFDDNYVPRVVQSHA